MKASLGAGRGPVKEGAPALPYTVKPRLGLTAASKGGKLTL
jgi:hypothetical protein